MSRRTPQLELPIRMWGGRRAGAGRKPTLGRRPVPHRPRELHDRHCPAHVTLRAASGVPSLRHGRLFLATWSALAVASTPRFRVLHYSVQADHLHLVVEADGPTAFEPGVRGLAIGSQRPRTACSVVRDASGGTGITPDSCARRAKCGMRSSMCCRTFASTFAARAGSTRARRRGGSMGGVIHPKPSSSPRRWPRRAHGSPVWGGAGAG